MKYHWGKPIGGFRVIVRNLRTVFSFRENEISPPLYRDFMLGACVVEKVRHEQQFSHKTSRVLRLEQVEVEDTCLTVKCLLPGVCVSFN